MSYKNHYSHDWNDKRNDDHDRKSYSRSNDKKHDDNCK
jgi:hypothetical protein